MVSSLVLVACLSATSQCDGEACRRPVAHAVVARVAGFVDKKPVRSAVKNFVAKKPVRTRVKNLVAKKPVRCFAKRTVGFFKKRSPVRKRLFPRRFR